MSKSINIFGITTNNLKDINVTLEKNSINLIVGPSGSGKSSLVYDTISQIGQHEFMSMFADDISEPTYRVKGFTDMVVTVPMRQLNFNNNIRSTIGTYFGITRDVAFIFAALSGTTEDVFILNREENICEKCHGLGFVKILDKNKLINYDIPLEKNPVRCWNRYKDFYLQIIKLFCLEKGIDFKKTFRQLSKEEQTIFLYGESDKKYSIKYKRTNTISSRTTKYYGVMREKPMIVNFSPSLDFFSYVECPVCNGKKYSCFSEQYKVFNLSIGEFMTTPFTNLQTYIENVMNNIVDINISFALKNIYRFVVKANELNLSYLYFHRTIPSLSGGELQRLRMIQVLNAQLSDLLIILDEPLAGISKNEKKTILKNILNLSKKHTIVIVDHTDIFAPYAKKIYALGESGGNNGGYLIDIGNYFKSQNIIYDFCIVPKTDDIHIILDSTIYKYKGVNITIGKNCLNLITGNSGIGKSTLLREYFPQFFEQYNYISQKPLLGNKNSSVATSINIAVKISEIFSKRYNKSIDFFSNNTGSDGMCKICNGAGYLEYDSGQKSKIQIECKECEGTGFNKLLKKFKINQCNIFDIWNMTIDEALYFFKDIDLKIEQCLIDSSSLLLGHLKIGQPISSLSGGENVRIKILKSSKSIANVLGIDEPFKGLNNAEIFSVVKYIDNLRSKGKTIVVIDHTEIAKQYFPVVIQLINKNSILTMS